MLAKRKHRFYIILFVVLGVSIAAALALYALKQNISLYFIPSQVVSANLPKNAHFRLGGMVVKHSVKHNKDLNTTFVLTDFKKQIQVNYSGVLPTLFKEGQGIVAEGELKNGVFIADQVLAKHDENYKPPELGLK